MGKKVTFTLPAEIVGDATGAVVLGEFNNWDYSNGISLKKQKDGSMKVTTTLEGGRSYQYRYLLNDGRWVNDQRADDYVHVSGFQVENCVISVPADDVTVDSEQSKARKVTIGKKQKAVKAKKAADDLTKIEGINKKVATLLAGEGIATFKALAKTSVKKLKAILEAAGGKFQSYDPSGWPGAAKTVAAGQDDVEDKA